MAAKCFSKKNPSDTLFLFQLNLRFEIRYTVRSVLQTNKTPSGKHSVFVGLTKVSLFTNPSKYMALDLKSQILIKTFY